MANKSLVGAARCAVRFVSVHVAVEIEFGAENVGKGEKNCRKPLTHMDRGMYCTVSHGYALYQAAMASPVSWSSLVRYRRPHFGSRQARRDHGAVLVFLYSLAKVAGKVDKLL